MIKVERQDLNYDVYIQQLPNTNKAFLENLVRKKDFNKKKVRDALLLYAVQKNNKKWIYDLIEGDEFSINDFIDDVNQKTLLASIIQYPYYEDLFVDLINKGADIFKETKRGDKFFRSNALMLSVLYSEFTNISYMLEKGLITYVEVLICCVEWKNFVLLGYFLSECPRSEVKEFLILSQHLEKDKKIQKIIDDYLRSEI